MFKDIVKLQFVAGRGGDGKVTFGRSGKPTGGDGGTGGSVYLRGNPKMRDYLQFKNNQKFKAEDGSSGGRERLTGSTGEDVYIDLPVTSVVYDEDTNEKLVELKAGDLFMIAQGGVGGLGNYYFRRRGISFLKTFTYGKTGIAKKCKLELELSSDFILIGFPNAGKSSLLKEITNAEAKVGAYAFTTIEPQLGQFTDITILDLPGLIEGTAKGKGLGTNFVKHTKRTKAILHCVSLAEGIDQAIKNYLAMREELANISPHLENLAEIIVLTKLDELSEDIDLEKIRAEFYEFREHVLDFSIIMDDVCSRFKDELSDIYGELFFED